MDILPLSDKEKDVLLAYSQDIRIGEEKTMILKASLANLLVFALIGRGLSLETHKITEKGEIVEIPQNAK